jgi:hypothetical protein
MSRIIDANPWNAAIILRPAGMFIILQIHWVISYKHVKELTIFTDSPSLD